MQPPTGEGYVQIGAGVFHSVALHEQGYLHAWGSDVSKQIRDTPWDANYVQVDANGWYSIALRNDGTLVAWGSNAQGLSNGAPAGSGFDSLGGGSNFFVALRGSHSGSAYCFGDGTGAQCPCSANGGSGAGCASSTGGGAKLRAIGNAYLGDDQFKLSIVGAPNNKPGLILRGANQLNNGQGTPLGGGLLCTGGSTARSSVKLVVAGSVVFDDFAGMPFGTSSYGISVPVNYQFWYRDPAGCNGAAFNFSNAWTVTWEW